MPILLAIYRLKYQEGASTIDFSLDDVRMVAADLGIVTRNPGDVIYRMRSRTLLPAPIRDNGFNILRQIGRGHYRFERAVSTLMEIADETIIDTIDTTPLPVRRLLPELLAEIDEQGLLSVVDYCKLLSHFTGLQVFRLRSHVRKSVAGVGQVEVDEVDVGVALRDDDAPIIFPIEAKAALDPVNRVQIANQVIFALQHFPGHEVRPIVVKVDHASLLHMAEFNAATDPNSLVIVKRATYRVNLSERQREMIRKQAQVGPR
ncbi:MAG: hypothetical protein JNL82_24090 [Myxococcales bacterium]|nr:hypothetical protein [Myxococcales bacterium]